MADPHESGKLPPLRAVFGDVTFERIANDVRGGTSLAAGDPLQLRQKSGVQED